MMLDSLSAAIRGHRRVFAGAVVALAVVVWTAVGASAWFVRGVVTSLPDAAALHGIGAMAQSTTLLDVNGNHAFTIFKEQRIEVPLERISPHLIKAILSIEDQRFYQHGGVDIVRVLGAAWNNLREGRAAQGGSTITQQLARQSFLTPDKTLRRKITEIIVAARLERQYEKDEILELYLNKVYFGDGLYGVEAASLGYFGKPAAELDVAEAALLAGLVKSPSTYAPTVNLEQAVSRRNVVLQAMRSTGAIDAETYQQAIEAPVHLNDALRREEAYGQYFKEEVRKQLVERFGWERVYQGGLRVYTTLDLEMQKAAEAEIARALADIEQRQTQARRGAAATDAEPLQAALVAIDPATGEVRAMVGGRDFNESAFNRATQARRQPGSAFKPFVYAAALERGYSPATLITNLDTPIPTLEGDWVPEDEHVESPEISMRTALRVSSNRAAVQMLNEVGISVTAEYAERLGMGSLPRVPSLALGSGEVTLTALTAAFGAFANKGIVTTPTLIRRVETTDGEVLYTGAGQQHRAVSESTAFLMATMLADVINAGTGAAARRVGFTLPAAGKTGTTNDYRDAWFVGFTPNLVAGVWVGYDQSRTIMANGYSSQLAVPLWGRFMRRATADDEPVWFRPPSNVVTATICRLSGKLATPSCGDVQMIDEEGNLQRESMSYTEYFVHGTEPHEYCDLHSPRGGFLATLFGLGGQPDAPVPPPPPAPAAVAPDAPEPEAEAAAREEQREEPPRRRSFWARIFGIGGDRDRDREQAREEREERERQLRQEREERERQAREERERRAREERERREERRR